MWQPSEGLEKTVIKYWEDLAKNDPERYEREKNELLYPKRKINIGLSVVGTIWLLLTLLALVIGGN